MQHALIAATTIKGAAFNHINMSIYTYKCTVRVTYIVLLLVANIHHLMAPNHSVTTACSTLLLGLIHFS